MGQRDRGEGGEKKREGGGSEREGRERERERNGKYISKLCMLGGKTGYTM